MQQRIQNDESIRNATPGHWETPMQPHPVHTTRFHRASWALWIVVLILHGLFAHPVVAKPRAVHTGDTLQTPYPNWMRWVPDSTPLSVLSIPGTHDTMSHYGGPIAKTQSLPLAEQLRAGIRSIDIRTRHIEDRFAIHHGIVFQQAMFGDVLNICNDFLTANPTETILLWLAEDGPDAVDCTRDYHETFEWYRDQSGLGGRIATIPNPRQYDIPLGNLRGKILVLEGFDCGDCGGIPCGCGGLRSSGIYGTSFWDLGSAFDLPNKWESILIQALAIDAGPTSHLYDNPLSASSSQGAIWPIDVANGVLGYEGMNYRYLRYLFTGNQQRTTGIVDMDFPGSGLIAAILAHNLKLATNRAALASDIPKIMKDISYSATGDGDDKAIDQARQIKNFLEHVLPSEHWSVLAADDTFGIAFEPEGYFAQSDEIKGYTHIAMSSRRLDASITSFQLLSFLTPDRLTPLSGEVFARAADVKSLLKTRFPEVRWNVAVKRAPADAVHWAAELSAVASAVVPVVDDGALHVYTVWATSRTNLPPVARPGGPYVVNEGSTVIFDASPSGDPAGDVLQYRWDFDGNGTWDTDYSYEPTITHVYSDNPAPRPWLEVFDGVSRKVEKVSLTVLNVAPTIPVSGPIALGADRTLSMLVTIADPGADSWTVDVLYGDGTPQITPALTGRTFALNHAFPATGYFQVELNVRDDDGGHGTTRFRVVTGTPKLDIQRSGPSAVQVSWTNHPAPFRLESSAQATVPVWQPVSGSPTLVNGRQQLNASSTNGHELFRLRLP